ncbi:hypothetical protein BT93_F1165 [Corymbia citriodora subsp. variegata]|nr:hypothetical protein BT93_F1165 [Corymbia citriodora subsp. variegata]
MDSAGISVRSANARVIESLASNSQHRMGGGRARSQSRPLNARPQSRECPARDKQVAQGPASLDSGVGGGGVSAVRVGSSLGLGAAGARQGQDMAMADRNLPALPQQRGPSSSTVRSWANVAKSATTGYSLSYIPPADIDDDVVHFSEEILEAADSLWKESLVGYFVGKKLPFKLVETALKHLWGHQLKEVKANDQGFYFFHIPDHEFQRKVVEGGPLTVARVPLILQQWLPKLELRKGVHTAVPVWIRLKNLPYALWTAPGLSAVASRVGKPLYIDQRTKQLKLISYARVCVEITATNDCCESLKIDLNGEPRMVEVEYEWKPISCKICGTFGHKCPVQVPAQEVRAAAVTVEPSGAVDCNATVIAAVEAVQTTPREARMHVGLAGLPAEAAVQAGLDATKMPAAVTSERMLGGADLGASAARPPLILNSHQVAAVLDDARPVLSSKEAAGMILSSEIAVGTQAPHLTDGLTAVIGGPAAVREPSPLHVEAAMEPCSGIHTLPHSLEIPAIDLYVQVPREAALIPATGVVKSPHPAGMEPAVTEGWQQVKGRRRDVPRPSVTRPNPSRPVISTLVKNTTKRAIPRAAHTLSSAAKGVLDPYISTSFSSEDDLDDDPPGSSVSRSLSPLPIMYRLDVVGVQGGGDFNAILDSSDRMGSPDIWILAFDELKECLEQAELFDLRYVGFRFTWSSFSGVNRKQRKIDRVLVNNTWCSLFSYSEAAFLAPGISDHSPMVVRILAPNPRRSPFKFFNMWMTHPDFSMIVSQVWHTHLRGSPMFKLYGRLKLLKGRFKILNREAFSDITMRASEAKQALSTSQEALLQDPFNRELVDLEHLHIKNYYNLRSQEELLFKQKSRIRWLKEGDQNTKFFHQSVTHRHLRNRIISVRDNSGRLITNMGEVHRVFISYFQESLAPVEVPMRPSIQEITEVIQTPLNED